MSQSVIEQFEAKYKKSAVVTVKSGDTVKVHQKIKEGSKERVQVFQGLVIRVDRKNSHTGRILVRRIASGVGVEKSFLLHSPSILKIEVVKRSKVRRNYLSYMRSLTGKATRLTNVDFDKTAVNDVKDDKAEAEQEKIQEQAAEEHLKAKEDEEKEEKSEKKSDTPEAKKQTDEETPKTDSESK